jgi:hypothetical protein
VKDFHLEISSRDKHTTHLLESVTHRESKGLLLKEISVRVIKELHPEIGPKEKRTSNRQVKEQPSNQKFVEVILSSREVEASTISGVMQPVQPTEQI